MDTTFLIGPFHTTDTLLQQNVAGAANSLLSTIEDYVALPFLAVVTLWIIVQGILVMRGDMDARRGTISLIRISIVAGLVLSLTNYNAYIGDFFSNGLFNWVDQIVGSAANNKLEDIPSQLDSVATATQLFVSFIAPKALAGDDPSMAQVNSANEVLLFGLWVSFAIYEVASIFLRLLVAIGPLVLIGYLFEATRQIAVRWAMQMLSYGLILLLFGVVATFVIQAEVQQLGNEFTLMMATTGISLLTGSNALTTPARIYMLYEIGIMLATGNALIIALPTTVATLVGGTFTEPHSGPVSAGSMARQTRAAPAAGA